MTFQLQSSQCWKKRTMTKTIEGYLTWQLCAMSSDEWEKEVTVTHADKYEREGKSRRFVTEWEPMQ